MPNEQRIAELRAEASKQRAIARKSNDQETIHGIFAIAAQLEQEARKIERASTRIRKPVR
jgi:hypothetical protein